MSSSKIARFFSQPCNFIVGASNVKALPNYFPHCEIAFIGRSNVGKSSLINTIFNNQHLAKVSKTPGRTQQINLFTVAPCLYIADLPGYGYANVSQSMITKLSVLVESYFKHRQELQRVFLLVDARHGLKRSDIAMLEFFNHHTVCVQIVLTKIDKIKEEALVILQHDIQSIVCRYSFCNDTILTTSKTSQQSVHAIRQEIYNISHMSS
ncbi:ribosome biogenesis GTP-binding protein YihA/YsxC [Rickettsiales endosymbiont of Peranema trichophorum]|uniref:ribosome biogenesis GTP-binding protein YihA/YsxC n=1 Tax=Rickettsiales endosymbiont of Peranema trichophorum TaxID=2486577 RepID=UPI0013EE47F7|nr:ribosome biogenesis GTP-binding protein YihA/YsxC [Rickettsiales endosymbiont of Peranema trichophorum]